MAGALEVFKFALNNLSHQKLRSYLTLISVVIGIAAIVTFIALGEGLKAAVNEQFEQLGSNTIFVAPGTASFTGTQRTTPGTTITRLAESDLDKIRAIPEVSDLIAPRADQGLVEHSRESLKTTVIGLDPEEIENIEATGFVEIAEGRNLKEGDAFVAIIGHSIASGDIFTDPITLRSRVTIQGESFRVVGIAKESSQSFGGGPNVNQAIFIPDRTFKKIFTITEPGFMIVKTDAAEGVDSAKEKIDRILEKRFGKDQKEFQTLTGEQIIENINSVLGVLQVFLVGIASISLLVGGLGIMNTMVMAVLERTSEIGVMKAIGATNGLVRNIFILEAGLIGLIGGLVGVGLGYALAFVVEGYANSAGFALSVPFQPTLVAGALAFSMLVGMASGTYPAVRASSLDPVEALRGNE